MRKTITKKWLEKRGACKEGINKFVELKERNVEVLIKKAIASRDKCNREEYWKWAEWLLQLLMTNNQITKYDDYANKLFGINFRPEKRIEAWRKLLKYGLELGMR